MNSQIRINKLNSHGSSKKENINIFLIEELLGNNGIILKWNFSVNKDKRNKDKIWGNFKCIK
jgi:hypothetical protein